MFVVLQLLCQKRHLVVLIDDLVLIRFQKLMQRTIMLRRAIILHRNNASVVHVRGEKNMGVDYSAVFQWFSR